jgi:hypothetical protein
VNGKLFYGEAWYTNLSSVGSNVINTLGPNIRQLFVDARGPIAEWGKHVDVAVKKFKADWDKTGNLGDALKLSLKSFFPTLYGFLSGIGDFGRGYGKAFVMPMLDSLKAGYARIADAMGGGDGIEAKGRALGEMMRPMTAIIDEVTKAIAFLIENFKFMSNALEISPLKLFVESLTYVRSALDVVGDGLKWLGQALGLIDPNSTASGFTVLLGTLAALAAAAFANKIALGAMGAVFNVFKFALGPIAPLISVLKFALLALGNPIRSAVAVWGVLTRGLMLVRIAFALLRVAILANPIGLAVAAVAVAALLIYRYWGPISTFFKNMWSKVTASFSQFRASLSGLSWGQVVVKIITAFASLPGKLLKMGVEAIAKLAIGIMTAMGIPEGRARSVVVSIVAALANLPSKMLEMGKNAMQGLADGIVSAGKRALEAAKQIASDIGGAVKGFFNINSPSRLMMGYGGNISTGLALGISADGKQAIANAKAVADGVSKQLKPLQTNTVVSFAESKQRLRPVPPALPVMTALPALPTVTPLRPISRLTQPKPQPQQASALPPRESLVSALTKHRHDIAASGETKHNVGGEIRVRIESPAGMNTSAKVSKPAGSKVGITANVGRVSW